MTDPTDDQDTIAAIMRARVRTLTAVTADDDAESSAKSGRPLLFGWGLRYVERISGRCSRTIRNAIRRGIPLHDPAEMVAWAVAQRNRELADQVLVALGYAPRHAVAADAGGMQPEPPGSDTP